MAFTRNKTSATRSKSKNFNCATCLLYEQCENGRMKPFGNGRKGIMNIGEAPGEIEDQRGKPWQGRTGRYLARMYKTIGIDLFEDCVSLNAINCRPPNNATPTKLQIDCCRRIVNRAIEEYQPKVIVLFGGAALQSVIGNRWKKDLRGIMRWQGFAIPDQDLKCWIVPTFHPSFVLREDDGGSETVWLQDLQKAVDMVKEPFVRAKEPEIHFLEDLEPLRDIRSSLISIDFETTGLKPQAKGHRIVCASVAVDENTAYVFPVPDTPKQRQPFTKLLVNPSIGKMAHNIKFEDTWAFHRLGTKIVNWEWDSMLAAHILDNRTGVSGLKFQAYVNFGIIDYDSGITSFLQRMDEKNANALNYIYDADPQELMWYCALDTIYQYRLAMKQIELMDYNFLPF